MAREIGYGGFMLSAELNEPILIIEDDNKEWRLYKLQDPGYVPLYRCYHKHTEGWVSQLTLFPVCSMCRQEAPEEMIGMKNLIAWER